MEEDEDFFKVYSQVPLNERSLTVAVIDNEPISWKIAREEIQNRTERAKKILKILRDLGII